MKLDREQRAIAFNKLHSDREQFWAQTDVKAHTVPELIERFLNSTDSTLEPGVRLIFFADESRLGWAGVCQVFEYMLTIESDPNAKQGTYGVWMFNGMAIMKDAESLSLEDRVRVAADLEAIIERAGRETAFSPERTMGQLYYAHPLRAEQPQVYLLKSKEWFERAIEKRGSDNFEHSDFQTLGHVYFELGDFKSALHWYKTIETMEHCRCDTCEAKQTCAHSRLVECQQQLSESNG